MNSHFNNIPKAGCKPVLRWMLCALMFALALPLRADTARYDLSSGADNSGRFIVDTRSPGNPGRGDSGAFTVDTHGALAANVTIGGRVTDTGNTSLPDTAVNALQNGIIKASTACDSGGNYQLPLLPPGTYEVRATKLNYLTGLRQGLVLTANQTVQQNFALAPRPISPVSQVVTRTPEPTQTPVLSTVTSTQFKVFSGDQFVTGGTVNQNKPTVVMTHGWNSDPDVWAKAMAKAMKDGGVDANLCAWDWRGEAGTGLIVPVAATPRQAEALAQALSDSLGGTQYQQPLHFIGHSLGTCVNGMAADILHGDSRRKPGPQVFAHLRTHMTLLDDAELTEVFVLNDAFDEYYTPIPARYAWADNYFTATGRYRANAVNAYLERGYRLIPDASAVHRYPCVWYRLTVGNPLGSTLGFRFSFEKTGSLAPFPTSSAFANGTFFEQDLLSITDELSLRVSANQQRAIDLIAKNAKLFAHRSYQASVNIVQSAIQSVGSVTTSVGEKFFRFGETLDWSLRLDLTTRPRQQVGLQSKQPADQTAMMPGGNTPAYVWLLLTIPTNAATLTFDFALTGDGSNDVFVAGVNGTNVFAQEARLLPQGITVASGPIEVTHYAGQSVELFFGLVGDTSTNATVSVDGIRFQEAFRPPLEVATVGNQATVSWPISAPNFVLESASALGGTNQWSAVTNTFGVVDFQYTLTNDASGVRFFRLRNLGP